MFAIITLSNKACAAQFDPNNIHAKSSEMQSEQLMAEAGSTQRTLLYKASNLPLACREELEWSGAASRAAPCTVGYLAEAEPSLETARCQAAESHSQQLADSLSSSDRQISKSKAPIKLEEMGAAGADNARGPVLVSVEPMCLVVLRCRPCQSVAMLVSVQQHCLSDCYMDSETHSMSLQRSILLKHQLQT